MKLKLLVSIKIYLVVNINRIMRYKKPVKKQRVEEPKLGKINKIKK